jgi:hypothetical protein
MLQDNKTAAERATSEEIRTLIENYGNATLCI